MIKLLSYNNIDQQQWQTLANDSSTATWFQTSEAYQFYVSVSAEMLPFAIGVVENEKLMGVVMGYVTKERKNWKQFFTRRAIIIGGPLLNENISDIALSKLLCAVKSRFNNKQIPFLQKPIYVEMRNFHNYSRWQSIFEQCGFSYQPHLDIHVLCNETHKMSEQRQRQVKKAIKNGVVIKEATSEKEIKDWYKILKNLYAEKIRTPLFSEEFFLQFYRQKVGKYLLVKFQKKVIGGMMCPILNNNSIYEWYVCGLDEEYKEQYPSVMATYAAIEHAKKSKIEMFDFMGAGKPNIPYGVRDFKMEFGGKLVEYGRFLYIRNPFLYEIGKLGVKFLKKK